MKRITTLFLLLGVTALGASLYGCSHSADASPAPAVSSGSIADAGAGPIHGGSGSGMVSSPKLIPIPSK